MSFADILQPQWLTEQLVHYRNSAYVILFLGAFFETLFPFSLAILGEVFFLSGALLAGMGTLNIWIVLGVLLLGGVMGDHTSYWMGRCLGERLFEKLNHWPILRNLFHHERYRKGQVFFQRRGAMAVLIARFSGPLSWVMPTLAGSFRLDYGTFSRFNALGVFLGIGQFILIGYFLGRHLPEILVWFERFGFWVGAMFLLLGLGLWRWLCWCRAST
jgi:membrane-associated protein